MKNNTIPLTYITRLMIALVALCVPASLCHASVEPELTMAIRQKNAPKVQELLLSGVNINERDEGAEQTPLMWAVQSGDVALVQMLLAHGAAVNAQDDFGKTALMFATEKNDAGIVKLLLRSGANPSVRDANAVTVADIAHAHRCSAITRLLARSRIASAQKPTKPNSSRIVALQ